MSSDTVLAEPRIPILLGELRELLLDIYKDREPDFQDLLETKFEYEYGLVAKGDTPKARMNHTIFAFKGDGGLEHVVTLAETVSMAKPLRKELKIWIAKIRNQLGPNDSDEPRSDPTGNRPSHTMPLPQELLTSLQLLEGGSLEIVQFVRDVRQNLRVSDHGHYELSDRFHLSDPFGKRTVAILQLETQPDLRYARWLSERVMVEKPLVAFVAAKALTIAALRTPRNELPALSRCIDGAAGLLDLMTDAPEDPAEYDIASRKRELIVARTLIEMRSKSRPRSMPPEEVDSFLKALQELNRASLERLCTLAQTPLWAVARPTDPLEHIAINIAVKARENNWERRLILAASTLIPGNKELNDLAKRYPVDISEQI